MFEHASTKSKLIVNAILLCVGIMSYLAFWFGTTYMSNIVAAQRAKLQESAQVVAQASETERILLQTKEQRAQVEGYFITDDKVVDFLEHLEALARTVGLEEDTDSVSDVTAPNLDATVWGGIQIVLRVKGSWTSVYHFLSLLERMPYRADSIQVTLEKEQPKEGSKILTDVWKGGFTLRVLKHK